MAQLRLPFALALVVLGAASSLAASLLHQRGWGLALGLVVAGLVAVALPGGLLRIAFMLGWSGALIYALSPRTEGDYLIPASASGYTLLGGSFLIFLAALATVPGRGRPRGGGSEDPPVLGG